MLTPQQSERIKSAFYTGTLRVRSVSPNGVQEWKRVLQVQRAEVESEPIFRVHTTKGSSVLTGGHRVFLTPKLKTEVESLSPQTVVAGASSSVRVLSTERLSSRRYMYDLTAEGWHNFILQKSGMLVSNSPDRNYHFRPPTHEETISQFSRVFGFIWENNELKEYLERSLDEIIASPPRTPFASVDAMVAMKPEWRTLLLTGAMVFALQALRINWVADEFDYTIGGVSLNLDKSSKYEAAQQAAQENFTQQLEKAKATVNILKGVQQPKFGTGIRSAFGPYAGRGVLSPRKFVGF